MARCSCHILMVFAVIRQNFVQLCSDIFIFNPKFASTSNKIYTAWLCARKQLRVPPKPASWEDCRFTWRYHGASVSQFSGHDPFQGLIFVKKEAVFPDVDFSSCASVFSLVPWCKILWVLTALSREALQALLQFRSPAEPSEKTQGMCLKLGTTGQSDLKPHAIGRKWESLSKSASTKISILIDIIVCFMLS